MDRLRPRERNVFSGFTETEIEKLESLFTEYRELSVNREFCVRTAKAISRSAGRAGKPVVKWDEVQSWFLNRLMSPDKATPLSTDKKELSSSPYVSKSLATHPDSDPKKANETNQVPKGQNLPDLSELEFEARSSRDGAWYDVDRFITHRFLSTGEAETLVRFVGFGAEEDEWVNVKNDVRERSIPLENYECHKVKPGDALLCLQERKDQAIYYDIHVLDVQRKMHDIRGCRCIFSIQYDHDQSEEKARLRRLCRRP